MIEPTKYLKLDLIDDHRPFSKQDLIDNGGENLRKGTLIGVVVRAGAVPRVVACFAVADYRRRGEAGYCLNEVARDEQHRAHLTTCSVLTITGNQLAELQETGELHYADSVVRLVAAAPARPSINDDAEADVVGRCRHGRHHIVCTICAIGM